MTTQELTIDQRKDSLSKFDSLADGISGTTTALGGFNALGLYAGQIKAVSLLVAILSTLPILAFGIALVLALLVKYPQWDTTPDTYETVHTRKRTWYTRSLAFLVAGIVLLFLATLVYIARAIQSIF